MQTVGWHSGKALAYSAKGLGFDSWPGIFMSEIQINCMDILWNCMGREAHVGIVLSGLYYKASNRPVSFKQFNLASCSKLLHLWQHDELLTKKVKSSFGHEYHPQIVRTQIVLISFFFFF